MRKATVADAFDSGRWSPEAEELFQRQFSDEVSGLRECYFCGSVNHVLTDCPEKPHA